MRDNLRNAVTSVITQGRLGNAVNLPPSIVKSVEIKADTVPSNKEMAATVAAGLVPQAGDETDFQDTPSVPGQLAKHPRTVLAGPRLLEQFDLSDSSAKDNLHALLAQALPEAAPRIRVLDKRVEFSPPLGKYIVCLHYERLKYLKRVDR